MGALVWLSLLAEPLAGQSSTLSRQIVFDRIENVSAYVFLEDSYGFLWVGADELYRYDGYELSPYRPVREDTLAIPLGNVRSLLELSPDSLLLGTSTGLFVYDRQRDGLRLLFISPPATDAYRDILTLHRDAHDQIWFGTPRYLYRWAYGRSGTFHRIPNLDLGDTYQRLNGVKKIIEPVPGQLLVATSDGMWELRPDRRAVRLPDPPLPDGSGPLSIQDMQRTGDTLWLATRQGLWTYDLARRQFTQHALDPRSGTVLTSILIEGDTVRWLGENDWGLWRYAGGRAANFRNQSQNGYSLIDHNITTLYRDRFANLWIGTQFGTSRVNFRQQRFPFYQISPGPGQLDNYVSRVMQDSAGGLWFRLLRLGLGYSPGLDTTLRIVLAPPANFDIEEIKNFCIDADRQIWVATLSNGLYRFNRGDTRPEPVPLGDSILTGSPLHILADRVDPRYLWFSSRYGLCRVERRTGARRWFRPTDDLPWVVRESISMFEQADDGNFYCTAQYGGHNCIIYFDRNLEWFIGDPTCPGDLSSFPYDRTGIIRALPGNRIGIASASGFTLIDATAKTAERFDRRPGFPLREVRSFTHDRHGNWWFAGPRQICKYDGIAYFCHDASADIERFQNWAATLGNDGRITFGGRNGIYSFHPDSIDWATDTLAPRLYLTGLRVHNERRRLGPAPELVDAIRLPFRDNSVTFEFAALHFARAGRLKYRYRLAGSHKQWIDAEPAARRAPYTHLPPGRYTFTVQATHQDSSWRADDPALHIALAIVPPFYRTWWAYGLYVLLIGGLLLGIRHYELRRKLARAEAEQLKRLDAAKTRLYTNITHEFRTPLTVIQGIANRMRPRVDYALREDLHRIQDNGRQLLDLVDQLLGLAKLERGELPVELTQTEVISFLKYLLESFHSLAAAKQLELRFRSERATLTLPIDKDKLRHIVTNLLANAVKFTPSGGQITLAVKYEVPSRRYYRVEHPDTTVVRDQRPARNAVPDRGADTGLGISSQTARLAISVTDTGPGIPAAQLPRIFDRFYQVDGALNRAGEGTGIGLALAKELAHLLGGSLAVTSTVDVGSCFTLQLPVAAAAGVAVASATEPTESTVVPTAGSEPPVAPEADTAPADAPRLLIVEDSPDLVYYLRNLLGRRYRLTTAPNGVRGLARATADHPDIILSDVMMPEMDGYELCRRLKTDLATSHIPIVLLTAKADLDSRLAGLEEGADAYLAKPFAEEELLVRLQKLLESRARLRTYYTAGHFLDPQPPAGTTDQLSVRDRDFLERLRTTVKDRIDDPDLTAEALSQSLHLSYATGLRKVKAVTGLTIGEYVRRVRLHRAAALLVQYPERTIAAIALDVGFASAAHFSREFRKAMGEAPSVYREKRA